MKTISVQRILLGVVFGMFLLGIFSVASASELEIQAETEQLLEMFDEGEEVTSPEDRFPAHAQPEKAPAPFKDSGIKRKLKDGTVQEFDGNKYKIVRRTHTHKKKAKPAPKAKKLDAHRNRVSVIAGQSPSGNLDCNSARCRTEREMHLGLQYMRDFSEGVDRDDNSSLSWHGLIQVQTNKSVFLGLGVGF